jgi:hypothetical protein
LLCGLIPLQRRQWKACVPQLVAASAQWLARRSTVLLAVDWLGQPVSNGRSRIGWPDMALWAGKGLGWAGGSHLDLA